MARDQNDATMSRRALLKASAVATTITGMATVGSASEIDTESCHYEYTCTSTDCSSGSGSVELRRQCCNDPGGGYLCAEWETNGCC